MELTYNKEKPLFVISLTISILFWTVLLVGTFGMMLVWVLFFFLFYLFAQSAFISYLKGTAVKITPHQFPDLHQRIVACSRKLGVKEIPEAYLLHAEGAFNALATRFLGRHFIVLFSDVVDALEEQPEALNFYIGHELGHIARRHLGWAPILFPAGILPILGAAYSRAREYTCDRYGLACCATPRDAEHGLAALAAGGKRWKTLSQENYAGQSKAASGFWMSLHELVGDYPWLVKRMAAIQSLGAGKAPRHPRRNPFAFLFALFVPRLGTGAGSGGLITVMVVVAIIGILAAIAIPAYQDYAVRAKLATALPMTEAAKRGVVDYAVQNQAWPNSNDDLQLPATGHGAGIHSIIIEEEGVVVVTLGDKDKPQGSLVYTPYVKDKRIHWQCSGDGIPAKHLPPDCRE